MRPPISKTRPGRSASAAEPRWAAFGGGIYRLLLAGMLLVMLAGCHDEAPTDLLLAAEREAPIGWVRVRLFRDSTFELSLNRGSWKRGTFRTVRDTFLFDYLGETDSVRQRAVVNGKT